MQKHFETFLASNVSGTYGGGERCAQGSGGET